MSKFFNHRILFDCPAIPARLKSTLSMEINYSSKDNYLELESVFEALDNSGVITIPSWMVVKWIEEEKIVKMPKIGVKTINDTLAAIAYCLSE